MSLKWLSLTDVHFGASHVPPDVLHDRLKSVVYPLLKDIDLLTLGGDFFDNALYLDSSAAIYGNMVLADFVSMSKVYNFAIRVIRGTYTHDRDQMSPMTHLAKIHDIDFKYYTDIGFDRYKGYSFLFLPDNLPYPDIFSIMDKINETLENNNEKEVDCVVGHGYFEHMLPAVLDTGKHLTCYNAEAFKNIVKRKIIMGHVHTPNIYKDFVYYGGSFDRLNHGEEETKGCLLITLNDDKKDVVEFIPNPFATMHVTVTLTQSTIEDCINEVKKVIDDKFPHPPFGYLRIAGGEMRIPVRSVLQNEYQGSITLSDIDNTIKQKKNSKKSLEVAFKTFTGTVPTKETIGTLLFDYLSSNVNDFPLTEEEVNQGISDLLAGV